MLRRLKFRKGKKMTLKKEEILRKLLHLIALLMPISIYYIPYFGLSTWIPAAGLGIILGTSIIVEYVRMKSIRAGKAFLKIFGYMMRPSENNEVTGSTYIIAGAFICSLLFMNTPEVAFISLFLFITGDAMAAVIGLSIGKTKIFEKSVEGSAACLICCILCLEFIIPLFPGVLSPWKGNMPFIQIVSIALGVTLLELVPMKTGKFKINDNLAAPVLAGFLIYGIMCLN